ncbi:MAG TPA: cytochrome c3 family protein [Geobacteraceae bacterium]|nr:cytochrome c3 family protein [Geobacteraceae bacterium]
MIKHFVAAVSAIFFVAASLPSKADTVEIPAERNFPSAVGEVIFRHQMHIKDLAIKCVDCHHQINAKTLSTPHPDYFKSSSIKCEICHNQSEKIKQKAYSCSGCHRTNPINIADETLSAKVVIHKQCWNCHKVGTGKEASGGCAKCHSGKKTQ